MFLSFKTLSQNHFRKSTAKKKKKKKRDEPRGVVCSFELSKPYTNRLLLMKKTTRLEGKTERGVKIVPATYSLPSNKNLLR